MTQVRDNQGAMNATLSMMLTMAVGSAAILSVAVSAPDSAPEIGISAAYVGFFTGIVYFVAMFTGSFCAGFIVRYGPIRILQYTGLCAMAGLIAFTLASPPATLLCALLLGLAYGPINPANAPILLRATKASNRSLFFSIKQSGVTVGGAAAALIVPLVAEQWNWQAGIMTIASIGIVSIIWLQLLSPKFADMKTEESFTWSWDAFISPVKEVLRIPLLRGFAMVGFTYAGVQISVSSFFVVFLVEQGFTLVEAGVCFLFVNIGGILGRLAWGGIADQWLSAQSTLTVIGVVSAISIGCMFLVSAEWNHAMLYGFSFVVGASSHGWNGVFLAEVASQSPAGESHTRTGGVQFLIYGGVAVMPPLFGGLVLLAGSYVVAFFITAISSLAASVSLIWLYRHDAERV